MSLDRNRRFCYKSRPMPFHRPGATVLVVENMPEMHESFTTSWWRRHLGSLSEPTRRAVEWALLEVADVLYVVGAARNAAYHGMRAVAPAMTSLVPYAVIAAGVVTVFSFLF